jgi:glycerol-3-phosphate dehydrogenase
VTIVGGKLTTYRTMAQDAVDAAFPEAPPSRTARLALVGAGTAAGARSEGVPPRLVERYGSEAAAVHRLAEREPGLAETLPLGVTVAELAWAVRHEGALDVGDLLDRRTRIGLVPGDRAAALPAAERVLRDHGLQSGM